MTPALLLVVAAQAAFGGAGRLERLLERRWLAGARGGILVAEAAGGRVLWERDADRPLVPASNAKLVTTAAALARLGDGFAFETHAAVAGGALHVWGGGDPSFSGRFHDGDPTAIFRAWAARLREAGVAAVGDLVLHEPPGDEAGIHPDWAGYARGPWWTAPVAWWSLNDNCVDVTVSPAARAGEPPRVSLSPPTAAVAVVNRAATVERVEKGKDLLIAQGPGSVVVSRQLALRARPPTCPVAVEEPVRFFGSVLAETLRREGIGVTGSLVRTTEPPPAAAPLATTRTDLARTLRVTNARSQNFYAEMLGRRLAVAEGRPASFAEAAAAVNGWAAAAGAKATSLADCSGLSRKSRTTARDLVTVLAAMSGRPVFVESLAVGGGEDGTLRERFTGERLLGRVRAKTGTLAGVDALSGYVSTRGGRTLAFSILLNGHKSGADARALADAIVEVLVEE